MGNRTKYGIISFAIIFVVLIVGGISFYEAVWSFPGNFDIIRNI